VLAAVYVRISDDTLGSGLGVARQERDCRELAARLGWTVADIYCDNSVSAYSGKVRPAYVRMLGDLENGKAQALICWDVDRLTRRPVELEHVIDLAEKKGIALASVGGEIDLATPQGRLTARIKASVGRHESEQSSRRIRRKVLERAEAGKPHGRAAYGWRRLQGRDVIDPAQANIIQASTQRVLAGESLRSVATDLNARQVPGPRGGTWDSAKLRQVLLRERNSGLRRHQGKVIGAGDWEAIIETATFNRLTALLTDPSRRTSRTSSHRYLLSGLALCGACDGPLRVLVAHGTRPSAYVCPLCYGVRRKQVAVDALVQRLILQRLALPDALAAFLPADQQPLLDEAAGLRARLDLVADQYANDQIDSLQLTRITSRLRRRLQDVEAEVRESTGPDLADLAVPNIAERWSEVPLERKRAVISLLAVIRVLPIGKTGRATFDPAGVSVTWQEGPAEPVPEPLSE
jgi:site-specific DNA recombinase